MCFSLTVIASQALLFSVNDWRTQIVTAVVTFKLGHPMHDCLYFSVICLIKAAVLLPLCFWFVYYVLWDYWMKCYDIIYASLINVFQTVVWICALQSWCLCVSLLQKLFFLVLITCLAKIFDIRSCFELSFRMLSVWTILVYVVLLFSYAWY